MTIHKNTRNKKQQYDINREGAALSFGKIEKCEYLTGE